MMASNNMGGIAVINLNNYKGDLAEWLKDKNHLYIGRGNAQLPASDWQNPQSPDKSKKDGLEICLDQYREHIKKSPTLMERLPELKGMTLGCHCRPKKCHADILIELYNSQTTKEPTESGSVIPEEVKRHVTNPPSWGDDDDDDDDYDPEGSNFSSSDESVSSIDTLYDEIELDSLENLSACATNLIFKVNSLILINSQLKKKILSLEKKYNEVSDKLYESEIYASKQDQYLRRNNVEFCGIPEHVTDKKLEEYIIKLLKSLKVDKIESYDIVAAHRLGRYTQGKPRNVIVRFLNRKNAYRCLGASKKLRNSTNAEFKRIYVIENLCPMNKRIFGALYKLKKNNKIKSVWSYNGSVFYTELQDEEPYKVLHLDEIQYLFEGDEGNTSRR